MSNIYWPVYKNLESALNKLSYSIHIDDHQLKVYSSNISDLILRASAEIESISKELYKNQGGLKTGKIKYDTDALEHLNNCWKLEKKVVVISSYACFQTIKEIQPFNKNVKSSFHGNLTFSWNNSYQNLKHDRANSLHFGCLQYLFDIMAALFVLNLYYKDESFDLRRDSQATSFPLNMGSELFSVKLHNWISYDAQHKYGKKEDFDECLYLTKFTDQSIDENKQALKDMFNKQSELFAKHPKFHEYLKGNKIQDYNGKNLMWDVLGKEDYQNLLRIAGQQQLEIANKTQYEAVLNKHIDIND